MDTLDAFGYFLLNVIMLVIMATMFWGINALIVVGLVITPLYLTALIVTFIEGAFGFSPLQWVLTKGHAAVHMIKSRV